MDSCKIIILLGFLMFSCPVFGDTIERAASGTILEVGSGDRDISPFLKNEISKWGKYFKKISAECNKAKIFIKIYSSGDYLTFNEIREIIHLLAKDAASFYPLYDIKITALPSDDEKSWHCMQWHIENGQIISHKEY